MSVWTPIAIGTEPLCDAAEFFRHHHGVGIIEARAAEFDRLVKSEETEIPEFLEQRVRRKLTGRFPFVDMRIDLGGDELLQRSTRLLVLGREQHGSPSVPALVEPSHRRHCERIEAIQGRHNRPTITWIATSLRSSR